jgi:hypothetical protein
MTKQIEVPKFLAHLPTERGMPVPFTNQHPDFEWETLTEMGVTSRFAVMSVIQQIRCARERLCGICGQKLSYWIAFVGGPLSSESRAYVDPPMHEECAEFVMQTCPYVAHSATKRNPQLDEEDLTPQGFDAGQPAHWVVGVTRSYDWRLSAKGATFIAGAWHHQLVWRYDEAGLLQFSEVLT